MLTDFIGELNPIQKYWLSVSENSIVVLEMLDFCF